jgi:CRP-like cAMP-binding protein
MALLPRRRSAPDLALLHVAPFDRYPAAALRPLACHADRLRVPEGTPLTRTDHRTDEFMVVLTGSVILHRDGAPAGRLGPGTQIGGPELLGGARHCHTLVAGPDLELLVVYGPAFRWAARTLPNFTTALTTPS